MRADRPARAHRAMSSASTEAGRSCVRGSAHERGETVPHRLRGLHRDLLADDRARQRGEGIAAALQAALAELRDELAHHAVAPATGACRRRPSSRGWSPAWRASPAVSPSPRWCPGRRVLQHDALAQPAPGGCGRPARSRAPSWPARALRCAARWRLRPAPLPACRKARGACCSTPSVAAQTLEQRGGLRPSACGSASPARSNSTATATGVLKSSFIAARKAAACGCAPVDRRRRAPRRRRARCTGAAARCAHRRGWRR